MMGQYLFQIAVVFLGAMSASGCAVLYFQHVRVERPPIGTFNGRDVMILLIFIILLPMLYIILPSIILTGFLILTFSAAMYLGLTPLLRARYVWPIIAVMLTANIIIAVNWLDAPGGWQVYWIIGSMVVLVASVSVGNLYVQGGLRLRHIAWFGLALAVYDVTFTTIIPFTLTLADRFAGHPLDPSMGFRMGFYSANIGLGDLLFYCLFATAAYKGFGRRGLIAAFIIIPVFGALVPAMVPITLGFFVRSVGIVFPAQASFGPAAFVTYLILSRKAPERSMKEWLALEAASGRQPIRRAPRRARRPVAQPALASVPADVAVSDLQGSD